MEKIEIVSFFFLFNVGLDVLVCVFMLMRTNKVACWNYLGLFHIICIVKMISSESNSVLNRLKQFRVAASFQN